MLQGLTVSVISQQSPPLMALAPKTLHRIGSYRYRVDQNVWFNKSAIITKYAVMFDLINQTFAHV